MSTPKSENQSFDLTPLLTPISIFLSAILISVTMFFSLKGASLGTTAVTTASSSSAAAREEVTVLEHDYEGGPVKGDENGKIVVVEYTDFQCPFCKRHYDQTYPTLKTNYIDSKKIAYVSKDFPLSFHASAQKAGEAAQCALEQGKYWEMHDKLFQVSTSDGNTLLPANLKQYAKDLGLDSGKFDGCLDGNKYANAVKVAMANGEKVGVSGTPGFFIGERISGTKMKGFLIPGAYPISTFDAVIKDIQTVGIDKAADNFEVSLNQ